MSTNFWNKLSKPFFILAPMEDVTDIVFRQVIKKAASPDVFFTEFTNSASYNHSEGVKSLRGRLMFDESEQPVVAHIWGDKPEDFEVMAKGVKEMGFSGVDINMGCPAPNVFKHGRGAGLILRPEIASEIIQACKVSGLPVSVKTRIGHAKVSEYKDWISHLLKQDLANISIHLRTKVEMSKVEAHHELIPDILKLRDELAPNTLITINGDIENYQAGIKLYEKYKVDGIMIGRGVFSNPFAFEKEAQKHDQKDLLNLFKYHLDLYEKYIAIEPSLKKHLHRFYKVYIHSFKNASDLRLNLMQTKDIKEMREIIDKFEESSKSE